MKCSSLNFSWLFLLFVVVSMSHLACDKQPDVLFKIQYQEQFTIPAGLNIIETHYFLINNIVSNYEAELVNFGFKDEQVGTLKPASGFLLSIDGGLNFNFIQEISIMLSSDNTFNQEAFYTIQVPFDAGNQINLAGALPDFKDIIKEDRFNVRIGFRLRDSPPATMNCRLTMRFAAQ